MGTPLTSVSGIGPAAAAVLDVHGYANAEQLAASLVEDLVKVPGFGPVRAAATLRAARTLVEGGQASATKGKSGKPAGKMKKKDGKKRKKGGKKEKRGDKGKKGRKGKKEKKAQKKKKEKRSARRGKGKKK